RAAGRDRSRRAVDHQQRLVAEAAAHRDGLRLGGDTEQSEQQPARGAHGSRQHQSRKLVKLSGASAMSWRTSAIAACRSSRFVPVTRTVSPWIAACTFSLLCLIRVWIFFAVSLSIPFLTTSSCLTLSPPIFSILALR